MKLTEFIDIIFNDPEIINCPGKNWEGGKHEENCSQTD